MAVNFQRIFIVLAAFIIIGLVILIIMQNKVIEKFAMISSKNIDITAKIPANDIFQTHNNMTLSACEEKCTTTPSCLAASFSTKSNTCWLKSTVDKEITDINMTSLRFPCELYNEKDFSGKGTGLDVGNYTLSELEKKGYIKNSLMSFRLHDRYKITLYDENGFGGMNASFTTSQPNMGVIVKDDSVQPARMWSNSVASLKLEMV